MKIFFFVLVIIMGICANTFAQNPYIRHYTTIDGLPTNTIYQIYQDSRKFLWFTSDAGVVKFDGTTFTPYRKKDGLSSNDVVRIKEDFKGRIWIFNYNASVNYIYNNKIFNSKNAPFLNFLMGKGFFLDFFTDSRQTLHFYNWQREVYSLDTNSIVSKYETLRNISYNLPLIGRDDDRLRVIYLSKNQADDWVIWTNAGIFSQHTLMGNMSVIDTTMLCKSVFPAINDTYYVKTYSFDGEKYNNSELLKTTDKFKKEKILLPFIIEKIKTIIEDSDGYLWIAAYDDGVYCLKNNKVVRHFDIKNALGLLQDHEANIWISTQADGIYVINHDLLEQNHFDRTAFDNSGVNLLSDFPGTGIWCTTTKAAFLLKNDNFYKLQVPDEVQPVNMLHLFKNQSLMLGSRSLGICVFNNIHLETETKEVVYSKITVNSFAAKKFITDFSGSINAVFDQNWIMFINPFKPAFNSERKKFAERINNAFYNSNNDLVINSKTNFIFKNNKQEPYPELSRFNGSVISDYLLMDDSTELFNIDGDSLYILKNHKFYNLTTAFDSPVDIQINKMLYKDSTLYLATLKDVFVCHNPMKVLSGFPVHLEPLNTSFNNINDMLIIEDMLYIASDDGLTVIAESSVSKSVAVLPIPYIKTITVNDKVYNSPYQELNLTGKNNIKLSFGCISYSSSPIIYSYKLEGSENKWTIGTGSGINLVYQNLPKGKYVFKLRVRKSNSDWSEPLNLAVTIKPTLVELPLFWAFVILIAAGILFMIITLIRNEKMKRVEVDHQLIVMEQKALQSMMNPHFIFNSLGSIQNYLLKNKGSEAVIYLSQFARLIRQNLNAINTPMIKLEEEVDRLRNYIDLEKKRLDNKFDYSIEIDTELEEDSVFIPGMIIQPITENSIWHGIATLEENGFIKISFQAYKSKSLKITIEDNGIGMKKSKEYSAKSTQHNHLGMQIIKKRLDLLGKKYNTETSISYSECSSASDNPGTMVHLIMPLVYRIDDV